MEGLFTTYAWKIYIMERMIEPFSQFEKRTDSNILWLAEIFTRDYLEVTQENIRVRLVFAIQNFTRLVTSILRFQNSIEIV